MDKILLHSGIIELIILFLLLSIYYGLYIPEKHKSICLLGTYVGLKALTSVIHSFIH